MACNTPIVATRVGDIPELLEPVSNCYISNHNATEIGSYLYKIFDTNQRSNGRDYIQYLSSDIIAGKLVSIYNELAQIHEN